MENNGVDEEISSDESSSESDDIFPSISSESSESSEVYPSISTESDSYPDLSTDSD